MEGVWAGVDVGGRRKGFHAAVVDPRRLVRGPACLPEPRDVVAWLLESGPLLVGVDSPRRLAPDGRRSRADESLVAREVCSLRYTPNRHAFAANPVYYEWIGRGLALFRALEAAGLRAVECFPTASWTRWAGARGRRPRTAWSRAALEGLRLANVPARLGQDGRDAIGAALTARAHAAGLCEVFGDIVVPRARPAPSRARGRNRR